MASDSDFVDSDVEFELYSQLHYNTTNAMGILNQNVAMEHTLVQHDLGSTNSAQKHQTSFKEAPSNSFDTEYNTLSTMDKDKKILTLPLDNGHLHEIMNQELESDVEDWEVICDDEYNDKHENLLINVENKCTPVSYANNALWKVCQKDIDAVKLLRHQKTELRYFGVHDHSNLRCKNCDEKGHISVNCTLPKKVRPCFKCGKIGHYAIKCPKRFPSIYRFWDSQCHRCGQYGHIQDECPDQWRQFHMTTKPGKIIASNASSSSYNNKRSCFNCGKIGHFGHDCQRSAANGACLVSPEVYVYDKWKSLKGKKMKKAKQRKKATGDHATFKKDKSNSKIKNAKTSVAHKKSNFSSVSNAKQKIRLKKAILSKRNQEIKCNKRKCLSLKVTKSKT